jgi:transaldolase
MKFFIDTANLQEIETALSWGLLDGVTTNPSLMAKEGIKNVEEHYRTIASLVKGDVSAEVLELEYEPMLREAQRLASLAGNIVVKVPFTPDGVRVIKRLKTLNVRTNCTLIFSAVQALIAAKAGATYVSPFIGRLDDVNHNGVELIEQICLIYENYGCDTQVLAASIRSTKHVGDCAVAGAHVATIPFSVMQKLFYHPLTDLGLAQFVADAKKLA